MAEHQQPPPGFECRTDNGRCFRRGAWDPTTGAGIVQFADGKIYAFGPMSEAEWVSTFAEYEQPGCTWNFRWKDNPPTHWQRLQSFPSGLSHPFGS